MTEEQDSRTLRRWFTVGAVVVVLWAVWMILTPLRMPIAWAAVLAFLLFPLQLKLAHRLGNRRTAAAGIITALSEALQQNQDLFDLGRWLDPAQHPRIADAAGWVAARLDVRVNDLQDYVHQGVQKWSGAIAKSSGALFLNTVAIVLRFFLMLFILFFILRDGSAWFERLARLLPLPATKRAALFTRLGKVLRAVVYGCGLTALVQGALVCVGFAITGLSGPIVFGVLAAILALLPFGGAALVWVPGVLYLLATGHTIMGIILLVWGGVVSVSDNFIRPMIISRYTPVPTLLVFLGVIGGVSAFGPIGFIFGPVILVLATELLRYAEGSFGRAS